MRVLFVCSMARLRSKTAAHCLGGIEKDYAGTDSDADRLVTKEQMDWADKIICMETCHRSKLRRKFKGYSHKMQVWNIPDDYGYMDDILIVRLRGKAEGAFA